MGHFLHISCKSLVALVLCACVASAEGNNATANLVLDFVPEALTLMEGELVNITLNILDNNTTMDLAERPWMTAPGRLTVLSDSTYHMDVLNGTFEVTPCDFLEDMNYTIVLQANNLGYAILEVFWEQLENTQADFNLSACNDSMYEPSEDQTNTTGSQPMQYSTTSGHTTEDRAGITTTRAMVKNPVFRAGTMPHDDVDTTEAAFDGVPVEEFQPEATGSPEEHEETFDGDTDTPSSELMTEDEEEEPEEPIDEDHIDRHWDEEEEEEAEDEDTHMHHISDHMTEDEEEEPEDSATDLVEAAEEHEDDEGNTGHVSDHMSDDEEEEPEDSITDLDYTDGHTSEDEEEEPEAEAKHEDETNTYHISDHLSEDEEEEPEAEAKHEDDETNTDHISDHLSEDEEEEPEAEAKHEDETNTYHISDHLSEDEEEEPEAEAKQKDDETNTYHISDHLSEDEEEEPEAEAKQKDDETNTDHISDHLSEDEEEEPEAEAKHEDDETNTDHISDHLSEDEEEEPEDDVADMDKISDLMSENAEEEPEDHATISDKIIELLREDAEQEIDDLDDGQAEEDPNIDKDMAATTTEAPPKHSEIIRTPKNRKVKKFQIYKEGPTFLFKRATELVVEVEEPVATKVLVSKVYRVKILRDAGTLDTVFLVVVSTAVLINTLMMGMQVDLAVVWGILKKPIGPAVGFFSQFAFMPAASYCLGLLLLTDPNLRLGLFTLGCSPGGNGSNFWTLMLKGDLNLSITMTLISTTSSLFMMPLWLFTVGQTIIEDGSIGIPFTNLFLSLLSFTIPVAVGVSIRRCKPTWADFAAKIIRPFTLVLILAFLSLSIWNSLYIFRLITWRMIVAGLSIAWGGYIFGGFVAWVCRQKRAQIIAISIETAIQNPGITFMVLRLTLPQPDSDISAVAPVAQLLVTSLPLLTCFLAVTIYRKITACRSRKMQEQLEEANRREEDVIDPLLIHRTSSVPPPSNGNAKATNGLVSVNTFTTIENRRESPPPPYPDVHMYAEQNESDLERNAANTLANTLASQRDSVDAVPLRNSEPVYQNFRNGRQIQPLRESKV